MLTLAQVGSPERSRLLALCLKHRRWIGGVFSAKGSVDALPKCMLCTSNLKDSYGFDLVMLLVTLRALSS